MARNPSSQSIPSKNALLGGLVLVLGLIYFQFLGNATRGYYDTGSVFVWWGSQWFNDASDLEHSSFLLLFCIGFTFYRWRQFSELDSKVDWLTAFFWIGSGLALNAFGYFNQQTRINCIGFLGFLYGVLLLSGGKRMGYAARFPLLLMVFTLPFQFLQDELGYYLRSGVIQSVAATLRFLGIPIERSGTLLSGMGESFVYDVAPACSGMRSLLILSALSLIVGGLIFKSFGRRLALFLIAFPLAFVGNWVRVSLIILAGNFLGQEAGLWVHEYFGFIVFIVVLGGALGTASLIEKKFPERDKVKKIRKDSSLHFKRLKWAGVMVLFLGSFYLMTISLSDRDSSMRSGIYLDDDNRNVHELPSVVAGEWTGKSQNISEAEQAILPPDTGFRRKLYYNWNNEPLLLSIILSGQDRSSIHRPEICLAAQGYSIENQSIHSILVQNGRTLRLSLLEVSRKNESADEARWNGLFAYWFVKEKGTVATHSERIVEGFLDRLRGNPSRWAYVLVQVPIVENREDALLQLEEFIVKIIPEIQKEDSY